CARDTSGDYAFDSW
nr:immunoglobulin heavy chain junction region [Macaca mulatta]MOW98433.1 immunoglobulin heavy chain junction region [Macaca mulatta]MOW98815.1 immunoglobulin heavy chain junction region [Macaca mulatta]MOW99503.1 immunoglobulin heavy chain junction region [Macaca mulatta]MOX00140.1 immunoglobulin heavy chain junction region [Macaca mulatta]